MATKRQNQRKRHKKQNKFVTFIGYNAFLFIVILGFIGWYDHSPTSKGTDTLFAKAQFGTIAIPNTKPSYKSTNKRLIILPDSLYSVSGTSKKAVVTMDHQKDKSESIPYISDTHLPPKGQFGVNNAANKIFAKENIKIFASPNKDSKFIAILKKGQEMRSYEQQNGWHRVVVPSTDIIGWAQKENLTKFVHSRPQSYDFLSTGSILKR
ncbi:hypothetical protein [Bartonella tamiae]|uniref:SH3b domain-containing protein n=1 Tax=Bartonella tamiae Th239 TaxID=1094558 RepID=J1JUQ6_9HYPH|nr:hypothetical protein [Bartonella tamiae]EJF88692.1 hypothetical protein ME5_01243 [Bartonella tamiae Th239]EJF95058.1 hypothetical protein MEG_00639 [Bartonella tamiae Th307]